MSFLTGLVTGPRTTECPDRKSGRAGLWPSVETLLYHEVAILLTGLVLYALLSDSPNQVGLWTFLILWVMRLSAKFNVYLGVPNLTEEFLPAHLKYLKSYFCHRSMNGFFPVSVTLSTIATVLLVEAAVAPGITRFEATGFTFLATLMALAVLEHWFLVIPIPAASLWSWGLTSRDDYQKPRTVLKRNMKRDGTDGLDGAEPVTAIA
jgi:putative photosynthetic complex assembly protein 2